jgi:hypothetical protein
VTGALFHEPSSGTASSVFPKFQPGFNAANAADAATGVKAAVHDPAAVVVPATVEDVLLEVGTAVVALLVLALVLKVVPAEVADVAAVPGTHCEYPLHVRSFSKRFCCAKLTFARKSAIESGDACR